MSVIYCCPACRDLDQEEHKRSCFLHPAWECKEAENQRATLAAEAGQSIKKARVSQEELKTQPNQHDASRNGPPTGAAQEPGGLGMVQVLLTDTQDSLPV